MKVLFVNAFQNAEDTAGFYRRFLAPMPPITLAYLAAALDEAGVPVRVYDEAAAPEDKEGLVSTLRGWRPELVCLSATTVTMPAVERVSRLVRATLPEARVVMGNIHANLFYESILKRGDADIVVHGEGEETIVELVEALSSPAPALEEVAGISFLADGEVVSTPVRPYIEDLDTLPFPAWHLFPIEKYRLFNFARVREPATLVLGSRGCPFQCSYCSLKVMGNRRRRRSAENIADEFSFMLDRFGYRQMGFTDPIFPFSKKEGLAFAAEIIRRGLHREQVWITETRTDLVDLELLEALREAGLRRIMFGFEAGDEEVLAAVRKGADIDSGHRAARLARKAGIEVIGFFMLGIPGSTRQTLQRTIDYARTLDIDFAKFTVFCPFPGTAVHAELMAEGKIPEPENWARYTSFPTPQCPPAYVPDALTVKDLMDYQLRAHLAFYLRPRMVWRHLFQIRALTPKDGLIGLGAACEATRKSLLG